MAIVTHLEPAHGFPVLLFDGDCGFCTATVNWTERVVRPSATIIAWQFADLARLGVTPEQCRTSIQWVRAPGDVDREAVAAAAVLRTGRAPWPAVAAVMAAPGISALADAVYRVVARYRYRLPGSTPACRAVPSDAPHAAA